MIPTWAIQLAGTVVDFLVTKLPGLVERKPITLDDGPPAPSWKGAEAEVLRSVNKTP